MISEESCELRKDCLLDMPVDVAKNHEGVAYGYIALAKCNVEGRFVSHLQIWYRFFERKTGQLCAVIERSARKTAVGDDVVGEGHEITGAIKRADIEADVVGQSVHNAELPMSVYDATILILAVNAGIIGISRMQYSLATHRQVPQILGRLSSRTLMPFVAIMVFGALAALIVVPGNGELLADMYAYGVLLSFTVAHLSIIALRWRRPDLERPFRVPLTLRLRGHEVPILAVLGVLGTLFAWVMVLIYHTEARWVGTAWMIVGISAYVIYRWRQGLSLTEAPEEVEAVPAREVPEVEYADILIPVTGSPISEEMIATAARLVPASEKGEKPIIHALDVIEVPQNLPSPKNLNLEELLPEKCQQAQEALDEARQIGEEYGVEVDGYTVGARHVGKAIVEEAQRLGVEVVMFGIPRKRSLRERLFGGTVDYVLKNCPCKIHAVVEEPRVA
jgi:APA family basic amino acid/polyamine antiporter